MYPLRLQSLRKTFAASLITFRPAKHRRNTEPYATANVLCKQNFASKAQPQRGHQFDGSLNIYYADHRFYDAETGTWLSPDPIKDGLNWYQYCGNNPTSFIDNNGLTYAYLKGEAGTEKKQDTFRDPRYEIQNTEPITINGRTYPVYVPTVNPSYPGKNEYGTSRATNRMEFSPEQIIEEYSISFGEMDWISVITNTQFSNLSTDYFPNNKQVLAQGGSSFIAQTLLSIGESGTAYTYNVKIVDFDDGNGPQAVIQLNYKAYADYVKLAQYPKVQNIVGSDWNKASEWLGLDSGTELLNKSGRITFDKDRKTNQAAMYLYVVDGQLKAYPIKFPGDGVSIVKTHFWGRDDIIAEVPIWQELSVSQSFASKFYKSLQDYSGGYFMQMSCISYIDESGSRVTEYYGGKLS